MPFLSKKNIKPIIPNVLLTNHCNQHCSYCFAQKEMKTTNKKEMSLNDFKRLILVFQENGITDLRLMGGEPTIHSKFPEMLELGVNNFKRVLIFSNGLIPENSHQAILKHIDKLEFNFNIGTPVFSDKQKRKSLVETISNLARVTKSSIAFTIFDLEQNYTKLLEDFAPEALDNLGVAFSYAKSIYGTKPIFAREDYSFLGKKIVETIQQIKKKGVKRIYLECGLKKEMFTKEEYQYLATNALMKGWGCAGKWSSFDIAVDLSVFPCFPFYKEIRMKLREDQDLKQLIKQLNKTRGDKGTCLT
ncbi:MAG: radical SAM protein [Patescibacteria group bacterium]|nr:radical SAM protein [Patescibacteria group bacterium]